jgi:hypothetical protein
MSWSVVYSFEPLERIVATKNCFKRHSNSHTNFQANFITTQKRCCPNRAFEFCSVAILAPTFEVDGDLLKV